MASSAENFLHMLEQDRELLARFRRILNLEDDYAKKSDLQPILEEMKAQRVEFSSKFDKVHEELKTQREDYNSKFDLAIEEIRAMRSDVNQINQRMDKS